jgi:hypothetical protein
MRELRCNCPLNAGCQLALAVERRGQAAGERSGEGEPVLERRAAPSHPQVLSAPRQFSQLTELDLLSELKVSCRLGSRVPLSFWVRGQEVSQHHEEFACVLFVPAAQCVMDIIAHHVADFFRTVRLLQQVPSDCSSCNLRDVLMLSNSHDLLFGEAT